MRTFIRVVEIWTPDETGRQLELNGGMYGDLDDFADYSMREKFEKGEGLPGRAWEQARAIVQKVFEPAIFNRIEAAQKVGLTSGIAIPIFAAEQLKAVVVFLCGHSEKLAGAIEVWSDDGLSGLALVDGYYGDLERFEWLSKQIRFPRGRGLPGMAWEANQATILGNLNASNSFLRSRAADDAGITTGIAIPVNSNVVGEDGDIGSIVTFLSSKSTPIAKRFEVWTPNQAKDKLVFASGIVQDEPETEPSGSRPEVEKGEGIIGQVWETGLPAISTQSVSQSVSDEEQDSKRKYKSVLAIPVYIQSELRSIVTLYN